MKESSRNSKSKKYLGEEKGKSAIWVVIERISGQRRDLNKISTQKTRRWKYERKVKM